MNFKVITKFPIALDSNDQKDPKGSIYDNSRNYRFNEKIYSYFKYCHNIERKNLKVLYLGCAGGGFFRGWCYSNWNRW